MTKPVVTATTLVTEDRVPIDAVHLPGTTDLAIVVAHGFTLSWQRPHVWRIANRLSPSAPNICCHCWGRMLAQV